MVGQQALILSTLENDISKRMSRMQAGEGMGYESHTLTNSNEMISLTIVLLVCCMWRGCCCAKADGSGETSFLGFNQAAEPSQQHLPADHSALERASPL